MSARISQKQRDFLTSVEIATRPIHLDITDDARSIPYFIGVDFAWNWNFLSEGEATRWVRSLEARGLVAIHKDHFVHITDAGRAAIATPTTKD